MITFQFLQLAANLLLTLASAQTYPDPLNPISKLNDLCDRAGTPALNIPELNPCSPKYNQWPTQHAQTEMTVTIPSQNDYQAAVKDPKIQESELYKSSKYAELIHTTKYLAGLEAGFMVGIMDNLPTSLTGWQFTDPNFLHRWEVNVSKGPHLDSDPWYWNYAAHPIVGNWYYTVCRSKNYSPAECLTYSFLVSAFIWEFGAEAIEEQPSIQDLIITPTAGAAIGEIAYQLIKEIHANNDEILGSEDLGRAVLLALNPIGNITDAMAKFIDPLADQTHPTFTIRYGQPRPGPFASDFDKQMLYPHAGTELKLTLRIPL